MSMNYIQSLQDAIKKLHGCESIHIESVPIKELYQGQIVWDGVVEVFELKGHPKAKRCYAWSHLEGKEGESKRFIAVLELPPVDSPRKAVQTAIISEQKTGRL